MTAHNYILKERILVFVFLFINFFCFSQKKYFIDFDKNTDIINYEKNGRINFFKILIDKKYYTFVLSDIKSDKVVSSFKEDILNRSKLKYILIDDNANKNVKYVLVYYKRNKYYLYHVDHLVRKITD